MRRGGVASFDVASFSVMSLGVASFTRTAVAVAAALTIGAATARAEPFKCPRVGGHFTFGQESPIHTLDQMSASSGATRNVAMNIQETLITRSENNRPILELAESLTEAPDQLSYTFKLRPGIVFHNGKSMTADDVAASFDRYAMVGAQRRLLDSVDRWEAADPATFVIYLKTVQPTFIEALSAFGAPIVIGPAELRDVPALELTRPIGTGPFQWVETVAGGVKLKRFDGYQPNRLFQQRSGFGGYKVACLDTVTFRIVAEPAARVAGLKANDLQAVENLPTKALADLRKDKAVTILPVPNWWIQIANPNVSAEPTDNLLVRKAIQAALDMDEIMEAASDGNYRLNVGFQYPNQPAYTDAGKDTYNLRDATLAKRYLIQGGYKGEPVVLVTNKDYPSMYNAALIVQQQLQAVGINAQMKVVDWQTSVRMVRNTADGWNMHFTAWGTLPSLGPLATMQSLVSPGATYKPKDGKDDPDVLAAWTEMNTGPTAEARQAAFARMQKLVLDRVYALPFGSLTQMQGIRANIAGYTPFRAPRLSNVSIVD